MFLGKIWKKKPAQDSELWISVKEYITLYYNTPDSRN